MICRIMRCGPRLNFLTIPGITAIHKENDTLEIENILVLVINMKFLEK